MNISKSKAEICELGQSYIAKELTEIKRLSSSLEDSFADACLAILACTGKVIVFGVGKSGHIGKKIAATLASTGTPAFFMHLTEAIHGDLGGITTGDVAMIISNSGNANELNVVMPQLNVKQIPVIGITGKTDSYLYQKSQVALHLSVEQEACPLGLAPTSSTTNTLILGDALALTVMTLRGFNQNDFAASHPAGALGSRLLTRVVDLVSDLHRQAQCSPESSLQETIHLMCQTGLGLIAVVEQNTLLGVFSDGDLRRAFERGVNINVPIRELMNQKFTRIPHHLLCYDALTLMRDKGISALPVLDENAECIGVMNMHTIHRAGIF